MATVRVDAEEMEARLSALYAEIDSLTDDLAEAVPYKEMYLSLEIEYNRIINDRSFVG